MSTFTEIARVVSIVACPILRIGAVSHHFAERGMRPVSYPLHQSVLHRTEVDIIDVPLEGLLMAQCVRPVASLPNAALAFGDPAGRNLFAGGESTREGRF